MRGWTDLDPNDEYARVQTLQNQGIPCPYCHAEQGHCGHCPLLSNVPMNTNVLSDVHNTLETEAKKVSTYRNDIPLFSTEDVIRMRGMGVIL